MSGNKTISAYTPSNTDPELLKRILVQREKLLQRTVDRLATSMTTGDKNHTLLVGPRGSGKTFLVSLVAWELQQKKELSDVMRVAWLGEDDAFSGLIHFAFAIAKALADEYPDEFPADFKSDVRDLPNDDAALSVLTTVVENLKHRQLLLLTENLDQTFSGLGDTGQKKLRAFLQETRRIATLATSQQLFAAVSSRKEAFFGFFDTHHLQPLTVDHAAQLIANIAEEQNKPDLIQFLNTTAGRYRVRALHHLAGGNHRMYVLLSEFLTRDTLDDLVSAFETLAEDMTPYFQERIRSLPDQQRQLVQCLCDAEGAMTVKQVAEETFIAEGNCSKQLGNLKSKGYVRSEKRGKESYYDMAEPLMRLCLEVKNHRGRPLKLLARFLKAWFPTETLQQLDGNTAAKSRVGEYCKAALLADCSFEEEIHTKIREEVNARVAEQDYERAFALADELQVSDIPSGLLERAWIQRQQGNYSQSIRDYTEVIERPDASVEHKTVALNDRAIAHGLAGNGDLELSDYTTVIEMLDASPASTARAFFNRGVAYSRGGKAELAHSDYSTAIEMNDASGEIRAKAFYNRGVGYDRRGNTERALSDYTAVLEMSEVPLEALAMTLTNRGLVYWQSGKRLDCLADYKSVLELPDLSASYRTKALFLIPEPLAALNSLKEMLAELERAFIQGDPESSFYGGTPKDLFVMVLQRGPSEWASYVSGIASLYRKYKATEKLGQGVTQSIAHLDKGQFSDSQLDTWNQCWQEAGKDCEDLQIPLSCLSAAVDVIKSDPKSDRPLFQLPLEIRQLIRPLLNESLGPPED